MAFELSNPAVSPAYRLGGSVFLLALATILAALGFEYLGGYPPCPLCLEQRTAYYVGIPLLFVALVLLSGRMNRSAALLFFLVALGFLVNTGLGIYQSGAEWKFWPGPASCGTLQDISTGAGGLLDSLSQGVNVVRCDEASWRFLGLSFAGWNAVISLLLFAGSLKAASLSLFGSEKRF
jgi:disulfide bond formation protein DsbB